MLTLPFLCPAFAIAAGSTYSISRKFSPFSTLGLRWPKQTGNRNTKNCMERSCNAAILTGASISIASDAKLPDQVAKLQEAIVSSENEEAKALANVRLLIELAN
jgi:hypothetical protein